jgi:catechol 2,3-dioxygenase-like lactoylglutathione lyase family enzyme
MQRFVTAAVFLATLSMSPSLLAQTAPPSDVVIGSGNFSPIVKDLDRSLEFYRNLLGVAPPANAAPLAFGADPALLNFLGTPTAQIRFSTVRIPGSTMGVEIVEFKDLDRTPVERRMQDPGAAWLILLVRDVDGLLARLKKEGVPVVTSGAMPVDIAAGGPGADKARAVVVRDPDGFNIVLAQLDQLPETTAPVTSNVIGARVGLTVADMDRTMAIYRDLLGFKPEIRPFANYGPLTELMNTPGAQIRRASATVPGSAVQVEFLEFKEIQRQTKNSRIQDPGSTRFQLRVVDTDATVKSLKSAGGILTTTGGNGGPIDMRGLRVGLVREPNNLFLVIMTQAR